MYNNSMEFNLHTFKKLIVVTFTSLIFLGISTMHSYAQTYFESPFDIQIFYSEQNPETKSFRVKVVINSKINSDRNTLKWVLPDGLKTKQGETEVTGYFCKINQGDNTACIRSEGSDPDTFSYELELVPYKIVDDNIIFSIQSYIDGAERSYKVTQISNLKVNSKLEIIPVSENYKNLEQILYLKQLSTNLMLIVFMVFVGLIILRKVYVYVHPPVKSSQPHNSKILDAYETLAKGNSIQNKDTK